MLLIIILWLIFNFCKLFEAVLQVQCFMFLLSLGILWQLNSQTCSCYQWTRSWGNLLLKEMKLYLVCSGNKSVNSKNNSVTFDTLRALGINYQYFQKISSRGHSSNAVQYYVPNMFECGYVIIWIIRSKYFTA